METRGSDVTGQLKLTLQYERGAFTVMVEHARGLAKVAGGQEPSTFVKVYLMPDRSTKRKTKIVRRNCHPTFMETVSIFFKILKIGDDMPCGIIIPTFFRLQPEFISL